MRKREDPVEAICAAPRPTPQRLIVIENSQLFQDVIYGTRLLHNHPSGDPTPSRADIAMTREIEAAAKALKIALHDHLVIGRGKHASFKALGLL